MRIPEERREARLRVSKLKVEIADAIGESKEEFTLAEICLALTQVLEWWQEKQFQSETPIKG